MSGASSRPPAPAPEFSPELTWLNAPRPLSMRELRGQLVILDFWTYCCVNCMHVVPVLRQLEALYAKEPLVVLGVHSAKFDGEKDAARIDDAIRRYGVEHPVLVDKDMQTWSAFAVRSWPTLVVVRPDGTIAAVAPGEPELDVLAQFVGEELAAAKKKGTLAKLPFAAHAAKTTRDEATLSYPGKVAVGPDGQIAVADSGHHRVLVLAADGSVTHTVGSGLAGHADGSLAEAAFDDPQGLAWRGPAELFVADARTHTIARIDLAAGIVTTVAGTGALGAAPLTGTTPALETPLRSPWDLLVDGDALYVALAGSHQIAKIDLGARTVALLAGTGAESIVDGAFASSTFSQPSGLASAGGKLYVADSETSAVRELDLDARTVRTVVGTGLFDFGDRDGPRETARMQHCLGVAADPGGALVVADTYNHKLRVVERATGAVKTLAGARESQADAGGLAEPGGLAWEPASRGWLVADTNHHRVVRVSADGARVTPVAISGAPAPARGRLKDAEERAPAGSASWFTAHLRAEAGAALAFGGRAEIAFPVRAPDGKKFAAASPLHLSIEVSRRSDLIIPRSVEQDLEASGGPEQRITLDAAVERFDGDSVDAEILVRVDAVVCDEAMGEGAVCEPYRAWLRLPVRLARDGASRLELERTDAG